MVLVSLSNIYSLSLLALLLIQPLTLTAAVQSNISLTRHNLGSSNPDPANSPYSQDTTRICVFCHTPHAANGAAPGPLWNRELSSAPSYEMYTSDSMDAVISTTPLGSSKLCLSCHDGVMDIGKIGVIDTQTGITLTMQNTDAGQTMPAGANAAQGYTRRLETNLGNDHPISFTYDDTLAEADGELYLPGSAEHIYQRSSGQVPNANEVIPLENGRVECITCHDPHVYDSNGENNKFLRKELNKFQALNTTPQQNSFNALNDIICLSCHDKAGWGDSAHADPAANYSYTTAATDLRQFPAGLKLQQAACLNCHDTHSGQSTRRLLREAMDLALDAPAQEQACYQCHNYANQDGGNVSAVLNVGTPPPDVGQDFNGTNFITMPITDANQGLAPGVYEPHTIGTGASDTEVIASGATKLGKDFIEGKNTLNAPNRHVECTDCHNPHRVKRTEVFNGTGATTTGVHKHDSTAMHTNIASGVLAGSWGVEPVYGDTHAFGTPPTSYIVKRGMPTTGGATNVEQPYVTREYQVCLKCHSDYAYGDTPPLLGDTNGGTPSGTNSIIQFTNQGMEFIAPLNDRGEATTGTQGAAANHRSWHPVFGPTGRTAAVRGLSPVAAEQPFLPPWNDESGTNIGNQTMYCTDCHGSNTTTATAVPDTGGVWGPHGSSNNFVLKGGWDNETGSTGTSTSGLCFKCHDWNEYANQNNNNPKISGYRAQTATNQCRVNFDTTNLHIGHAARIGADLECTWCHAAVPHGWKNKALLLDMTTDSACAGVPCTEGPYFLESYLGGGGAQNWSVSGEWTSADCGGRNWMNNSCNAPQ